VSQAIVNGSAQATNPRPSAPCYLSGEKKSFCVFAVATQFERAEILVPRFFWNFGSRFNPDAKLVQVLEADLAITHAFDR
jgi:hypothetical protein